MRDPRRRCAAIFVMLAFAVGLNGPAAAQCPGDCDASGSVTVDELVLGVNISLGSAMVAACASFDTDRNFEVTVDELVAAVNGALTGCIPVPTATATASAAPTPTATVFQLPPTSAQALRNWLRAGNYKTWHAESAPHPSGGPHGGTVRTFLNDIVFDSLAAGNAQHPRNAAVVKELYFNGPTVAEWAVEIKLEDQSNGGQNWYWYEGVGLSGRGLGVCTGCHGSNYLGYTTKDYVLSPFPLQ